MWSNETVLFCRALKVVPLHCYAYRGKHFGRCHAEVNLSSKVDSLCARALDAPQEHTLRGSDARISQLSLTSGWRVFQIRRVSGKNNCNQYHLMEDLSCLYPKPKHQVGPMAIVILGGLFTSTALNLLVLPTLSLRYGRFEREKPELT